MPSSVLPRSELAEVEPSFNTSPDDLLVDPHDLTRIVAALDWEMATVGDPLTDLGTTLGFSFEAGDPPPPQVAAQCPTLLPGSPTRRELIERYAAKTGRDVSNAPFYYYFGLFKIAVIVQQIYARYVRGQTCDPRFARLNEVVAILSQQTVRAVETERSGPLIGFRFQRGWDLKSSARFA